MGGSAYRELVETDAEKLGDGWRWPLPDDPDGWVGLSNEDDRWMRSKAVPQPVGTLSTPLQRTEYASSHPSTYVLCTKNGMKESVLEMVRDLTERYGWERHELETGHWPMVTMPEDVVTLLGDASTHA
ncbi:hypothetical protein [Haladaptatus sp. W1]|uniref:hypothetical protein n=1 Tax=Haladaptatus sp. W1 TaxID=1897478 RepID=UPI001112DE06|nr:hypothetical protein [Haladaptatus sp. W1]